MPNTEEIVGAFWSAVEQRDWRTVEQLCDVQFTYSLPQSKETYDREGFLRLNREYPGDWHVTVEQIVVGGDWLVSEVVVSLEDREDRGVTFFQIKAGKIVEIREYWPEPFPVPQWRARWKDEQA